MPFNGVIAGAGPARESGEGLLAGDLAGAVLYGTKFISKPRPAQAVQARRTA
ncbi:MAG TPA: hypothetical protein VF621_18585 [Pyrinomonadaceae bacterium]